VDARVARLEGQFETNLVVPFAGAAVHDRLRVELHRDACHRLGDDRPRQRGDQRILAFVERVCDERLRHLVLGELVLAVEQEDIVRAGGVAARDRRLEIGVLPDVDEHGHDLVEAVVLLQPCDRTARVQPARVGENGSPHQVSPFR
jgi:hypothetical protein